MKPPFTYRQLGEKVQKAYIEQNNYQMERSLKEFVVDGKYVGDYLNYLIFEKLSSQAPRFYLIGGPYDIVSKKAPQQALVFENGTLVLNIDWTHYADMRTGLMDALILSSLGVTSMNGKKILYLGTGNVAKESLKALKEFFPDLTEIDYINKSNDPKEFGVIAKENNIQLRIGSFEEIGVYDYIFAHTTAVEPVLTANYLEKIKKGAVITTFTGPETEVADEFFNTREANVITDWENSLTASKDLQRPLETGQLMKDEVIFLKEYFSKSKNINNKLRYTIYRSTGTPMQNLAVLQLLLESK